MSKSTEELAASKAGSTAEQNGFGSQEKPQRPGGLYRLKDEEGNVVDEQIVFTHPLFGDSQAAAFERVGYKYVRQAREDEVVKLPIAPATIARDTPSDDLKGIQARLNALEAENKAKDEKIAQLEADKSRDDADGEVKAQAKQEAKAEAEARVAAREGDSEGKAGEDGETAEVAKLKAEAKADAEKEQTSNEKKGNK